jgi:hypothetical protein
MSELRSVLSDAEREGLISSDASARLLPFLVARGVTVAAPAPADDVIRVAARSDTETPRFIRGFHDVLITIGIVIALAGLWGLVTIFAVIPAIIVLSEILVRRQRLALPAVALTIALSCATFSLARVWWPGGITVFSSGIGTTGLTAISCAAFGLYYLRYRVPLSLALCIASAFAMVLSIVLRGLVWASGDELLLVNHPAIVSWISIASAVALFATSLRFDLSDVKRVTTRSDIAFWLHMGAAPALLYSIVSLSLFNGGLTELAQTVSIKTPLVVCTVAVLMLIGLIIDRRAFVTSGLLSLGFAIYGIFQQGHWAMDTYVFATLLVIGVIVLVIGTGWMPLRRRVVNALPAALARRLPPA